MAKQIFVKPGEGRTLRNHQNSYKLISEKGELVNQDVTFMKRIKDGDAILVPVEPKKDPGKKETLKLPEPKLKPEEGKK